MTQSIYEGKVVQLVGGQAMWQRSHKRTGALALYRDGQIVAVINLQSMSILRDNTYFHCEPFPADMPRRDREIALYTKLVEFGLLDPMVAVLL